MFLCGSLDAFCAQTVVLLCGERDIPFKSNLSGIGGQAQINGCVFTVLDDVNRFHIAINLCDVGLRLVGVFSAMQVLK